MSSALSRFSEFRRRGCVWAGSENLPGSNVQRIKPSIRLTMRALIAAIIVALNASCASAGPIARDGVIEIVGTLTDQGIECPLLQGDDGQGYTLAGPGPTDNLGDLGPGARLCVRGRLAEVSFCMQGITVAVEWLGPAEECQD